MTDGWERSRQPNESTIEIPLSGDGPLAVSGDDPSTTPPPNWRKIVGLTSLAGVAMGILLSVVLINFVWDDDVPEGGIAGDPSTTIDGFDLATQITTPPTLVDLNPVPPITDPSQPTVTLGSPTTTVAPISRGPVTSGTLPDYPAYSRVPEGGLDSFDLTAAVEQLGNDVARRSTTHVEYRAPINTIDITIVRDPFNDRYRITFASVNGERNLVVDIDGGTTYITTEQGEVTATPNSELAGIESSELPAYFDRLMLGPIRPDTLASATVEPLSMVFFEGSATIAREFAIEIPGAIVPDWQSYDLDPVSGPPDEAVPETLFYLAYVDDQGELNRVIGTAVVEGEQQLVIHQIERLHNPEIVLLPDPALVQPQSESG